MKTLILFLIFALSSCNKDSVKSDPIAQLPSETRTGANTFGCIINNQVFYPRDGIGNLGGGTADKGLIFWVATDDIEWNEIDCGNFKDGKPASRMIIHLQGLATNGVGEYVWKPTNFLRSIDGLPQNNIYAKVFDTTSNSYKYYGSYENSGKVNITKYDIVNYIVSGNFNGKLRLKNGTEEIDIINGRFDIKRTTLFQTLFP